ncbi:MAG: alpha/beta hydrolase [Actinomycetota bacterium]
MSCGDDASPSDESGPEVTTSAPQTTTTRGADAAPGFEVERIAYGDDPNQFGDLVVASDAVGPLPVIVLIHGGFWRNEFRLDLAIPQASNAAAAGYAAWNIEYRRVGDAGGGYPGTLEDVAAAIDHLAALASDHDLDLDRVAVVGHSAGGHLALWAGQRERLGPGAPGGEPVVIPRLVVGQAPVADLANNLDLGGGAVEALMGTTPADDGAAYDVADPARLLPVAVPQLIVHGALDDIVPAERSLAYGELVGDDEALEIVVIEGIGHFEVIAPTDESWQIALDRIEAVLR